ncbi:MAG: hypothetical protein ACK4NQ_10260 [Fimbriimonadaceae bacterium]
MKPPQPTPSSGGPLRRIRAAVMPLTFTPRVVRHVSECNLTAHRLIPPIRHRQPRHPGP